ncbi:MAG: glycine betaine ABC transporter substrate-binding protein [Caldilineaceae bacterium]
MHLKRKKVWAAHLGIIVLLLTTIIFRASAVYATPTAQAAEEKGTIIVGSQEALNTQILAALSLNLLRDLGYEVAPITTENVGVPADLFWIETRISSTSFHQISGVFPIVGAETPEMTADIDAILQTVGANVDDNVMVELKALVENGPDGVANSGDEQTTEQVAQEFLRSRGLMRPESKGHVNIGSWEWTPPLIVTEITQQYLENAGYDVTFVQDEFVRDGVTNGSIDVYWDYTGSGITLWHGIPSRGVPQDPELVWEMIGELDGLHYDLTWLQYSSIDEAWVLMASHELYDNGMTTIDDLADYVRTNGDDSLVLCVEDDFYSSTTDGLPALFKFYDFALAESNINVVSYDELYEGMRSGACDVAEAFPDDGRLLVWDLPTLEDPRNFFVPFNLAPVVRNETLTQYPELQGLLEQVSALIDVPSIQQLSALVDIGPDGEPRTGDEQAIADVASAYLASSGLIEVEQPAANGINLISASDGNVAIGSWEWTPPLIVTEITQQYLQQEGYNVTFVQDEFVRDGVLNGTIDLYWDYTGSGITLWHGIPSRGVPQDPELVWEMIGELDGLHYDLTWLPYSSIDEAWVLMVSHELYDNGMTTIDDLADYVRTNGDDSLVICVEDDFYGSTTDGLPALFKFYDFELAESHINVVSYDELYESMRAGDCDVAEAFPDDGRLLVWDLPTLEDTRHFFVPFNLAPVVRNDTLAKYPELQEPLERISALIDTPTIQQLSALVDIGPDGEPRTGDEQAIADVAQNYLKQVGLIPKPQLVVASGSKPEQLILGKMLVLLLDSANYPVVDKTGMEDNVSVRAAMDSGEVDVIIDFSSDALVNQHGLPLVALPEDADKAHVLAASLDQRRDMVWLNRGALSDWSAVIARQELAQLGVTSIEDLGRYITETADSLTLCTDGAFFGDEQSGLLAMQDRYGFTFDLDRVLLMETDQVYEALRDGECTVGIGSSTDGRIAAWGLVELTDPLNFFPYNTPAPVVRKAVLEENAELRTLLNGFMSNLDENAMSKLTAQVLLGADDVEESGDEATPAEAAQGYLDSLATSGDGGNDSIATEEGAPATEETVPATEETAPEEVAPPDGETAPATDEQGNDGDTSASEAPATAGASATIDQVNYDGAELLRGRWRWLWSWGVQDSSSRRSSLWAPKALPSRCCWAK